MSLSGPVEGALRRLAKRSTARPSFSGSRFRSRASCKAAGLCRQAGTYSSVRAVPDIVHAVHGLAPSDAISGSLRRCNGLWALEAAAVTFAPGALRPRTYMRQVPARYLSRCRRCWGYSPSLVSARPTWSGLLEFTFPRPLPAGHLHG